MKLSVLVLAAYAVPAFALAVLYLPLFSYVTPFYAAERGVDVAALGAAWIVIRLFDAVSDPAIGWLSDRTPARLGRRRVWLAAAVPVLMIATLQVFVPPEDAGLGHAVFWLFLLTLGWTMAQTPYAAWGAELGPDYDSRTRITGWREAVVLVGTLAATILYFQGGEGGDGLRALALCVMVALPIGVLLIIALVPDRLEVAPARLGFREGIEALRNNLPFRRLLAAWFFNGASNGMSVTLFLFFVADRLGGEGRDFIVGGEPIPVAAVSLLTYFLCAIAGVPFWTWMARRMSKHRAWGIAMIWACIIFTWTLTLGEGDTVQFIVISILTGLAFGADLALPPAIQADVVELDTKRTGAARAGLFFAMWQVVTKAALAFSSGLALIALGAVGFEAGAGAANSQTALITLSVLYAGVPIVLKLIAVSLMWHFPLDRSDVEVAATAQVFR